MMIPTRKLTRVVSQTIKWKTEDKLEQSKITHLARSKNTHTPALSITELYYAESGKSRNASSSSSE